MYSLRKAYRTPRPEKATATVWWRGASDEPANAAAEVKSHPQRQAPRADAARPIGGARPQSKQG
jgi:hypothetical protein